MAMRNGSAFGRQRQRRSTPAVREDVLAALEAQRRRAAQAAADVPVEKEASPTRAAALRRAGFSYDSKTDRWWPADHVRKLEFDAPATVPVSQLSTPKTAPTALGGTRDFSSVVMLHQRSTGTMSTTDLLNRRRKQALDRLQLCHSTRARDVPHAIAVSADNAVIAVAYSSYIECKRLVVNRKFDEPGTQPRWMTTLPVKFTTSDALGVPIGLEFAPCMSAAPNKYLLCVGYRGEGSVGGTAFTYSVTVDTGTDAIAIKPLQQHLFSPKEVFAMAISPHSTPSSVMIAAGEDSHHIAAGSTAFNAVWESFGYGRAASSASASSACSLPQLHPWKLDSAVFSVSFASHCKDVVFFGCRDGSYGSADYRHKGAVGIAGRMSRSIAKIQSLWDRCVCVCVYVRVCVCVYGGGERPRPLTHA